MTQHWPSLVVALRFVSLCALVLCLGTLGLRGQSHITQFENRVEGTRALPAGAGDIEIASLTCGPVPPLKKQSIWHVAFFLPADLTATVEAQELQIQKQYFMRSTDQVSRISGWREFGPWPLADAVERLGIADNNLGVLVRLPDDRFGIERYSAAFVQTSRNERPSRCTYLVQIRTWAILERIEGLLRDSRGRTVSPNILAQLGTTVPGNAYPLPLPLADLPVGEYSLELRAHLKGRAEVTTLPILLYTLPPSP